jgi:CDGSH-type Zn-finger protein
MDLTRCVVFFFIVVIPRPTACPRPCAHLIRIIEQAHNNTNGSQFQPYEAQNSTDMLATKFVCACGESGTFPMCDGSHYGLTDERKAELTAKAEAYKQVRRYPSLDCC